MGKEGVDINVNVVPLRLLNNLPVENASTVHSFRTGKHVTDSEAFNEEVKSFSSVSRNAFKTHDPKFDQGHIFELKRSKLELGPQPEVYLRSSRNDNWYRGPIQYRMTAYGLEQAGVKLPAQSFLPSDQVNVLGARAINACSPLNPNAAISESILEAFSSLPSIPGAAFMQDKLAIAKNSGSEYLNVQFGWAPLWSDIRNSVVALRERTRILKQLKRDNGRNVRRRFYFPTTRVSSGGQAGYENDAPGVSAKTAGYYAPWSTRNGGPYMQERYPNIRVLATTETKTWFSGCFTYYIPDDDRLWAKLDEFESKANVLLGSRVTPATLYAIAPWSWLVDWKVSLGLLLENASAFSSDGLVLRYGYLMSHTKTVLNVVPQPVTLLDISGPRKYTPARFRFTQETKERRVATPYGFGIDKSDLSPFQLSILAALGISKSGGGMF